MNITLIISSLSAGGAERVMSIMANYWATKGWNVTLVTLATQNNDFYYLDSLVRRIALAYEFPSKNKARALFNNIKKILLLRQAIQSSNGDIVISFIDKANINVLLSLVGLKTPVLISERIDPTRNKLGLEWNILRNWLYPLASGIIVQTTAVEKWAKAHWPFLPVSVIPNPVCQPVISEHRSLLDDRFKWCIAVGRLTEQKGFDLLLSAFAAIKERDSSDTWRLLILGDGEKREQLAQQIDLLRLNNQVVITGRVNNPADYFKQADLFVLSSRFEGFPNALLEAMACGLPVISTDCPSGPAEIINHNVNGILVEPENSKALATAMYDLMRNKDKRKRLAGEALRSVFRFHPDRVMKQWESLIYEVTDVQPHCRS